MCYTPQITLWTRLHWERKLSLAGLEALLLKTQNFLMKWKNTSCTGFCNCCKHHFTLSNNTLLTMQRLCQTAFQISCTSGLFFRRCHRIVTMWCVCCRFRMYSLSTSYLFSRGYRCLSPRCLSFPAGWLYSGDGCECERESETGNSSFKYSICPQDAPLSWQSRVIDVSCRIPQSWFDFLGRGRVVSNRIVYFRSLGSSDL